MKRKVNINVGISDSANEFLRRNAMQGVLTEIGETMLAPVKKQDRRVGELKDISLHKYDLKDGSFATEFIQCKVTIEEDTTFFFIGLTTNKENFLWPHAKINAEIKWRSLN